MAVDQAKLEEAAALAVRELRDHVAKLVERKAAEIERQCMHQIEMLRQRVSELEALAAAAAALKED